MSILMRVRFHFVGLCPFGGMTADEWVASIGTAFGTGLLTIQGNDPLFGGKSGTLYVGGPDNITPADFPDLQRTWTHNCVVVDSIEQVQAQPTAQAEQDQVDAEDPGFTGGVGNVFKSVGDSISKFFDDVLAILKAAGIVVSVLAVLVIGFILWDTKPWRDFKWA